MIKVILAAAGLSLGARVWAASGVDAEPSALRAPTPLVRLMAANPDVRLDVPRDMANLTRMADALQDGAISPLQPASLQIAAGLIAQPGRIEELRSVYPEAQVEQMKSHARDAREAAQAKPALAKLLAHAQGMDLDASVDVNSAARHWSAYFEGAGAAKPADAPESAVPAAPAATLRPPQSELSRPERQRKAAAMGAQWAVIQMLEQRQQAAVRQQWLGSMIMIVGSVIAIVGGSLDSWTADMMLSGVIVGAVGMIWTALSWGAVGKMEDKLKSRRARYKSSELLSRFETGDDERRP